MRDWTIYKKLPLAEEQNEAIEFLLSNQYCCNSLQTGLGKSLATVTACAHWMSMNPDYRTILVIPAEATKAWKRELSRVGLLYSIHTTEEHESRKGAKVVIYQYSSIHKYIDEIGRIMGRVKVLLVCDEAHCLQNPKSSLYQTMWSIRSRCWKVWAVTATPLLNSLEGFYNLSNFIKPGVYSSWFNFSNTFMVMNKKQIRVRGGKRNIMEIVEYKNLDVLNAMAAKLYFVRKLKYDVRFHYLTVNLTQEEEFFYKKAAQGILMSKDYAVKTGSRDTFAARLHDLQRVVDNSHDQYPLTKGLTPKETLLLKKIRELSMENRPLLVYCEYLDTVERLEKVIKTYSVKIGVKKIYKITGSVKRSDREAVEEALGAGVVVLMTQAGIQSINLQRSNAVCFYDIPFAVGDFIQCTGRVIRMDSSYDHQDIFLLEAENTIDTYKRMRIQNNSGVIQDVIGGTPNLPTQILSIDLHAMDELKKKLLWKTRK